MSQPPLIGTREHNGPVLRLLRCFVCKTWEELPDHEGPAETDILLEVTLENHVFPSGEPHVGKMFKIPVSSWANVEHRKAILDDLAKGGSAGLDALDPDKSFYDTKMQFAEDAMNCWRSRLSPKDGCGDYKSESKRILPKTSKERKELGLPAPKEAEGRKIYICNFCPIESVVQTRRHQILGLYNK